MRKLHFFLLGIIVVSLTISCSKSTNDYTLKSPDKTIDITLWLSDHGQAFYSVRKENEEIISESGMGILLSHIDNFSKNWEILNVQSTHLEEVWEMPWGEKRLVENNYNQLRLELKSTTEIEYRMNLYFRAYNDGIGFRYEFPEQENLDSVFILEENTEFAMTGDHQCYWIPGDWDIYEHLYSTTKFTEIDAIKLRDHPALAQTYIPHNAVNTPVSMKTDAGLYLSFHEANLTDYSGMTLKIDGENLKMQSVLVGSENRPYKVAQKVPFSTPWRTIQIATRAGDLIESDLIVNLNEPNKLGDVSWFKPMKYVGIWWEMHIGKSTWDYASTQDMNTYIGEKPHGKHGATTENAMRYIDFAAQNNITGLLVEGWNTGWEHWIGFDDREGVFDFVTSYPDYDLKKVVEYGRSKGVELIMHHETSAAPRTYEQQLDTAFRLMQSMGIHSVKTGYVGKIIPNGEYHHGQWMVNHYRKVLETAAKYQIAINAHEPIKATGIRRTYPNAISREGLRGQEFNAWSPDGGNPPEHLPIVAFTRMLSGPIDFTPGIFNIKLEPYKSENQINTTLAQQLALYVVINSPVQMAADLPEYYEGHPAFQFIRHVPVNWEQTKVLDGEIGDFVCIARQDRDSQNWFLGAITDENERKINIKTDFLTADASYKATIYRDADDAHWDNNPTAYEIEEKVVSADETLSFTLKPGGGLAISFTKE